MPPAALDPAPPAPAALLRLHIAVKPAITIGRRIFVFINIHLASEVPRAKISNLNKVYLFIRANRLLRAAFCKLLVQQHAIFEINAAFWLGNLLEKQVNHSLAEVAGESLIIDPEGEVVSLKICEIQNGNPGNDIRPFKTH